MVFAKGITFTKAQYVEDEKGPRIEYPETVQDVALKFYHTTQGNEKNRGRNSKCEIIAFPAGEKLTKENGQVLSTGETKVFSGNFRLKPDQFDRRIGRKEALTRALSKTDLSKADKAKIWDAYRAVCRMPGS